MACPYGGSYTVYPGESCTPGYTGAQIWDKANARWMIRCTCNDNLPAPTPVFSVDSIQIKDTGDGWYSIVVKTTGAGTFKVTINDSLFWTNTVTAADTGAGTQVNLLPGTYNICAVVA